MEKQGRALRQAKVADRNFVYAAGPEWLGLRQITRYASVSERTIRGWVHSPIDALPAVRVGGKILIKRSELDAWLVRHSIKPLESIDLDAIVKSVLQGGLHGR